MVLSNLPTIFSEWLNPFLRTKVAQNVLQILVQEWQVVQEQEFKVGLSNFCIIVLVGQLSELQLAGQKRGNIPALTAIGILKVLEKVLFNYGVQAYLENPEAMPWIEKEGNGSCSRTKHLMFK